MVDIYPVTIIKDRYNGCYSGSTWLAWNKYETHIPEGASDNDTSCRDFWDQFKGIVGFGSTPKEAYDDLTIKYI
jgi:hypothetical protein